MKTIKNQPNVGKYTSPMDPMGLFVLYKHNSGENHNQTYTSEMEQVH